MKRPNLAKRFWNNERGVISTEAVLVLPLLFWAYLGLFTFFDAFRTQNVNVRASYTISDMLSRETDYVTPAYIAGLNRIFALLTQSKYPTILRVSVVRYDAANDKYLLTWSAVDGGTGGKVPITQATIGDIQPQIPIMADADTVVVVETWMGFVPMMNVGLDSFYFENLVVTRPRFAPQILWSGV